ncbi:hypothetical protein [Holophaga foetida]|uniref:hypothetical protein n=1 Tax=Holophaga foetida TaxID=35839 RepID=UPI0002473B01|nr:hypothetical protein [Holophaga foetida]
MTRIFTFGLESGTDTEGSYLVIQVAHRDSKRAAKAAQLEAAKRGGSWRVVHKAERRTGMAIPQGEILGATGPINFAVEE